MRVAAPSMNALERLTRRDLLAGVVAITIASCRRVPQRRDVLRSIVREAAVDDAASIQRESRRLVNAIERMTKEPTEASLATARVIWTDALLAWKRASTLRTEAIIASGALLRAAFWPIRTGAVEETLGGPAPLNSAFIDELGADIKGLYALEYMLFGDGGDPRQPVIRLLGPSRTRALTFAAALARDVAARADKVAASVGDGKAVAEKFAGPKGEGMGVLVTQMVENVERVVAVPLTLALQLEAVGRLHPREIEGSPSGTSSRIVLAIVEGTERFYMGSDHLGPLVAAAAPPADEHIQRCFRAASAAIKALGGPILSAARQNPLAVERARNAVRDLEIAMKTNLVGALGLSITFTKFDSD